jgi:hypothetical protein
LTNPNGAETDEKAETKTEAKSATFWHNQLDCAAKREEKWRKSGDEIQCRYMDDRDHYDGGKQFEKRINILWANTEVQKGALFNQLGKPDVRRSFPLPGYRNKVARTAALVMERALVACANRYEPDVQIESAVEDDLLPGRGICWIDYEPTVGTDPETGQPVITYQNVKFDHVEWKSFRHGNGRSWEDVPWVAREHLFTKTDLKKRWGEKLGARIDAIPVNQVVDEEHINAEAAKDGSFKRARVWEIWYKPDGIRVYVADGFDEELEREEDPYKLEGFFPCPRPLYAVKTTSSLTPRPEFLQYKDQADELDRVNTRIWKLLEKLKYCGVYDGSAEDADALKDIGNLEDGKFLPYKNFAALAERGGLAAAFQSRDLAPIAATVQALAQRAMELLQAIYEITGISDIMRGSSDSNETLGAQKLKANFGSGRLQRKQKDVQRFVKALYRMKAEIIAEHFERDQLQLMTGIQLPLEVEKQKAKMQIAQYEQMQQMAQAQQQAPEGQPQQPGQPPMPAQPQQQQPSPMGLGPQQTPSEDKLADLKAIADACSWEEIAEILRTDDRRNFTIDVETTETAAVDEETEKQQRTEFMGAMTQWLQVAIPAIQANPTQAPLFKELTMFFMGGFKVGRGLEESFEDAFDQIKNTPPQPNPEEEKVKAEMAMKQQEMQASSQEKQADFALKSKENEQKMAMEREKFEIEKQKMAMEVAYKEKELGFKERELGIKEQENAFTRQLAAQTAMQDREGKMEERQFQREDREYDRSFRERELGMKSEDAQFKRYDMEERRKSDMEDKSVRREMETGMMEKRASKHAANMDLRQQDEALSGLRSEIAQALEGIAGQLQEAIGAVSEQIDGLAQQQSEASEAMTAVVKHMTAPRKVKRDEKGRAVGVEVGQSDAKDMREMLSRLSGERNIARDKMGRVEAFA